MNFVKIKNQFDLYGYSPYLFIGGFKRNGSFLGLLSTLLSIIVGGLFSSIFIIDFISKKKFTKLHLKQIQKELNQLN